MIDWKKSCVVHDGLKQRVLYGVTRSEYNDIMERNVAFPVQRQYLEDVGRGRQAGAHRESQHQFFTHGLGRRDAEVRERGRIRR